MAGGRGDLGGLFAFFSASSLSAGLDGALVGVLEKKLVKDIWPLGAADPLLFIFTPTDSKARLPVCNEWKANKRPQSKGSTTFYL